MGVCVNQSEWSSPGFVDTLLGRLISILELYRTDLIEKRMLSGRIVEALDEPEDLPRRFSPVSEVFMVNELSLQRREERLEDRIIPAIALTAHAAGDAAGTKLTA